MERRQAGVLLLAAAVLAILVSAGLQPDRVAGSPQAFAAPGRPAVGDCLREPVNLTGWGPREYAHPDLQFEACDGFRFGEVVGVIADPAGLPATTGSENGGSVTDPNLVTCDNEAWSYLAMFSVGPQKYWSPRIHAFTALGSPSPLQRATGQRWIACTVVIPNDPQTTVQRYHGSLHNAFLTGNERELLGFCGSGSDWATGYVPVCSDPHDFQVLASGIQRDGMVTRDELQRTCVQVARRLTALPDVTAAGELAVVVHKTDGNGGLIDSADVPVEANLACGISTVHKRQLAGSLVAIGNLPIPWVS